MRKYLIIICTIIFSFSLSAQVQPGVFYKIQAKNNSFYFAIDGNTQIGASVLQQNTIGKGGEWEFISKPNNYYQIKNKLSKKFVANYGNNSEGATIKQVAVPGNGALWRLVHVGSGFYKLKNKQSNKFITNNDSSSSKTALNQKGSVTNGGHWKFVEVSGNGASSTHTVAANNFTVLMVGDPQFPWLLPTSGNKNIDLQKKKIKAKKDLNENVKKLNENISALGQDNVKGIIFNGDLTAFGHTGEWNTFNSIYNKNKVNAPMYFGIGNHDYANNVNDCVSNVCASNSIKQIVKHIESLNTINFDYSKSGNTIKGSLAYSWDIGNMHFVQLHNHPAYQINGRGFLAVE